ncbi:MAG: type II CRISPR RNA-guided endonuclease Cas9, partial [Hyphomicrobium sp.]
RFKRAKTPYQACSTPGPEAANVFAPWDSIVSAAQGLPSNKRWRFGPEAMERFENKERDFLTRQLNETRHLSRMARIYLSKACDPDQVYVTTGQLTAMLRSRWGLNSIWRDHNRSADDDHALAPQKQSKGRDDHRHHAVDACTIGAIDRSLLQEMSKRAGQAEIEGLERITSDVPEPFPGFRDCVRAAVDKVIVSMKPEHGMGGALHEDTAYGLVDNTDEAAVIGNLVYRKPLADLKPGEIDSVRDAHLRKQLQELVAPLRDAKGRLSKENEKAFEAALTKFSGEAAPGRAQGVRRVRIGKAKTGELHIKDRQTGAVYKALLPGENHHIDIVQMRDGSWQGFAATVFDVNQTGWRPEWEVRKLGGKLVMRVHKGDTIEVDDVDGIRRTKTVHRLSPSNGILYLAPHNEGGALGKRHDDKEDPFRWDFANIGGLKGRKASKVKIDAAGRKVRVRSNV